MRDKIKQLIPRSRSSAKKKTEPDQNSPHSGTEEGTAEVGAWESEHVTPSREEITPQEERDNMSSPGGDGSPSEDSSVPSHPIAGPGTPARGLTMLGTAQHVRSPSSVGSVPESLKEHLTNVKSSLEDILASPYQKRDDAKSVKSCPRSPSLPAIPDIESQLPEEDSSVPPEGVPVEHVRRLTSTVVDMLRTMASVQREKSDSKHSGGDLDMYGEMPDASTNSELLSDDKLSFTSGSSIKDSEISTKTALLKAQFLPQPDYKGDEVLPFYMDNQFYLADNGECEMESIPKTHKKNVRVNWPGLFVYVYFIVAFITYVGIRASKTLGLGGNLWYGIIVLTVECLGAIAMLPYGLCLSFKVKDPVPEAVTDALSGKPAYTKMSYHIRVVIPCYKEPLDVISKTFLSALYCEIPVNCRKTVYLLDDGKDPEKRAFIRSLGMSNAVYISGRKRAKGEMNGKSANINNAMRQIYPGDDLKIPLNEVICLFDADQVPNADFFAKTIPLLDGGEDVAMVLTPQAFYNLNHEGDIFNHANVHFWDYTQPGYDALGLISCTGTNFLLRAAAFKDAGWFPEWTLTEDFALGIELKRRNWQCRYVEEYLALGEAPIEVRNCFQQRSRWAKGHFQVFFGRGRNPAFGKGSQGLSLLMRWMYGSVVLSYFSAFLGTPLLMIVPIITVWFGAFPIVINYWAAVAITIYYLATMLLMYYTKAFGHLKSMWFASVSNSILWFAFLKAMYRSTIGRWFAGTIVFKVTAKGLQKLKNLPFRDVWMATLWFVFSLVTLIFGLVFYFKGGVVNTPLAISIIFMVYNLIPLYLLLQYTAYRPRVFFGIVCKGMMLLSFTMGILGLTLIWLLYPRAYDYRSSLGNSLYFFDTQRLGQLPSDFRVSWRGSAFTSENKAWVYLAQNPNDTNVIDATSSSFGANSLYQQFFSGRKLQQANPFAAAGVTSNPFSGAGNSPAQSTSPDPFSSGATSSSTNSASNPFGGTGSSPSDPFSAGASSAAPSTSPDPFSSGATASSTNSASNPFGGTGSSPSDPFSSGAVTASPSSGGSAGNPFSTGSAATANPFSPGSSAPADPFSTGSASSNPFSTPNPFGGGSVATDPFAATDPFSSGVTPELKLASQDPWDVEGGWFTGMKGGNIKATSPIAFSTAILSWGYMGFAKAFEMTGQTQNLLDSVRWGADYLMKTHKRFPALNSSLLISRVGDVKSEMELWYRPEDGTTRDGFAVNLKSAVGGYGADLGGSISAALSSASILFRNSGENETEYANKLLEKAIEVYEDAKNAKYLFSRADYNISVLYNSSTMYDDLAWAAGWLYKATRKTEYLDQLYNHYIQHLSKEASVSDWKYAFDWDNVFWPTNLLMAQELGNATFKRQTKEFLRSWMCANHVANYTTHGRAFNAYSAPLGSTANVAMAAFMYADVVEQDEPAVADSYRCWGLSQVRYVLGDSGRSLIVGDGHNPPERTQDRGASCPAKPGICNRVTGYLSPDPDTYSVSGALVQGPGKSDNFMDDRTNDASMVGIENNVGITGALAGAALLPGGKWEVCLQQFGIYRTDPICGSFLTI